MKALRFVGNAVLWAIAVVGVLSILVFGATKLGYVKPLVVISGSMEPKIMTGDLLFDAPRPSSQLRVGDVATIPSAVTGKLISHRVVAIAHKDGRYEINLKGDANEATDGETYVVGATVWRPVLQVPHGGYVVTTLSQRNVALPLGITLLALLGLSLVPSGNHSSRREEEVGTERFAADPQTHHVDTPDVASSEDSWPFADRIADLSAARRS